MGTRWRAGRSVVLAAVLAACSGRVGNALGTNAHPDCRTDTDCRASGGAALCDHGTCRIADAGPAGRDGGASEDSGSFAKPPPTQGFFVPIANPPPTSEPTLCPPERTLPPTAPCALPPPAGCAGGNYKACWNEPGAPGPEACPPSAAGEYGTSCCYATGCSVDLGNGCTSGPLVLPGQTAALGSACAGDPSAPGRVYDSDYFSSITMNSDYVFAFEGSGTFRVSAVSKKTCSSATLFESSDFSSDLVATLDTVYVAPRGENILAVSLTGHATPVDLSSLLGAALVTIGPLGSDGKNAYAQVSVDPVDGGATIVMLVELPCCGAAPKILARSSFSFTGGVRDQLVPDGNRVYEFGVVHPLDRDPIMNLGYFDLGSGKATAIFLNAQTSNGVTPLGVHHGLPYLVRGGEILTIAPDTCAANTVVKERVPCFVSAFASDDHAIYWAESYGDLSASRIFMKADGASTVVRVIEASAPVMWLGVDGTHIYWAERPDGGTSYSISRIALP